MLGLDWQLLPIVHFEELQKMVSIDKVYTSILNYGLNFVLEKRDYRMTSHNYNVADTTMRAMHNWNTNPTDLNVLDKVLLAVGTSCSVSSE